MRVADIDATLAALVACDLNELAAALTRAGHVAVEQIANATIDAATHLAYFPTDDVIAEADAVLYDVLRWPIADIDPDFPASVDPEAFAQHRGITVAEAQRVIAHLAVTDDDAVTALLRSGVEPEFSREQAQVFNLIRQLAADGTTPTRARLRDLAIASARTSLRPGDGPDPVVYPVDIGLRARIVSPHPAVHALLWLDRLNADPPAVDSLHRRLAYLTDASRAMGRASTTAAQVSDLARSARPPTATFTDSWGASPKPRSVSLAER